jgi:hypothetical protein
MGGPCSTNGEEEEEEEEEEGGRKGTRIDYWWESQRERDH